METPNYPLSQAILPSKNSIAALLTPATEGASGFPHEDRQKDFGALDRDRWLLSQEWQTQGMKHLEVPPYIYI